MDKWLYFHTATADSICLPVRDLVGMEMDGSGTALDIRFKNANTGDDGVGEYEIVLTVTDNAVMIDSNISSCGSITAIS